MRLFKLLDLNLQNIVFLILVPIITLTIAFMAWFNYNEMYETILNGFNKKLTAISSTTGSFIDGDEHQKLAKAKDLKALAYDFKKKILYGVDENNQLLKIDLEDGAGSLLMKFDLNIRDLTYNPKNGYLYASTDKNKIIFIDVDKKKYDTFMKIKDDIFGLVYIEKDNTFFATTENNLLKIYRKNRTIKELVELKQKVDSLTYNTNERVLYGVIRDTKEILNIDINTLNISKILFKNFPTNSSDLYTIEFNDNKLFGGNRHLMLYNLSTRVIEYENFARGFRDEKNDIYKKYITSMNKIKLKTGLTYHYTQELIYGKEDANCLYIFDVHEGNEYTPIGSEDVMDEEDILGAENVILRGKIYISKIKKWEQWGLLKVSFAPIMNSNGEVKGIAGADVNMEIIREKTREALIHSIIIGVIALIIGIVASYFIAKKIIEPITKLKYGALKIAAGRYGDKVFINAPKELEDLSNEFNNMSEELKNRIINLNQYNSNTKLHRREQELLRELNKNSYISTNQIVAKFINTPNTPDGYIQIDNKLYFWLSNFREESKLKLTQKREVTKNLINYLVTSYKNNFFKEFKKICKYEIYLFGYIDLKDDYIQFYSSKYNFKILTFDKIDKVNEIVLKTKTKINLKDKTVLIGSRKLVRNFKYSKVSNIKNKRVKESGLLLTILSKERV